jgi:hypothetical protein
VSFTEVIGLTISSGVLTAATRRLRLAEHNRETAERQADACRALIPIAAEHALDHGGEIGVERLLLELADDEREHVRQLLITAGLMEVPE